MPEGDDPGAVLQALHGRLAGQGSTVSLDPDSVGAIAITDLFATLLQRTDRTVTVRDATVVEDGTTSVTVSGTVDLFHVTGATGTFRFTAPTPALELTVDYPLGSCSIAQLTTAGLLPPGTALAEDPAPSLPAAQMRLDSPAGTVTVTTSGPGPTWLVPGPAGLVRQIVQPRFTVTAPPGQDRTFSPIVTTDLAIGTGPTAPFFLRLPTGSTPWQAARAADTPVPVAGLAVLGAVVPEPTVTAQLPTGLPTAAGYTLARFAFTYDAAGYVPYLSFRLRTVQSWPVVGSLAITAADVDVTSTTASAGATASVAVAVTGQLVVAGVAVALTAARSAAGAPWTLSGAAVVSGSTADFAALVGQLVSPAWAPGTSGASLPAQLPLAGLRVSWTPATGSFDVGGTVAADCSVRIGGSTFALRAAAASVHLPGTGDTTPAAGILAGTFRFDARGEVRAQASLRFERGGSTVIRVARAASSATALDVPAFADGLSGSGGLLPQPGRPAFSQIVPAGLDPRLSSVAAAVDVTDQVFLMTGSLSGTATAYLLYRSTGPASEYVYAAAFGAGFTFGALLPALAGADQVLGVADATLAVYTVGAGGLTGLKAVADALAPAEGIAWPLPATSPTPLPVTSGVVLQAGIRLAAGTPIGRLLRIGLAPDAGLRVLAVVDRSTPAASVFVVSLPAITMLSGLLLLAGGRVTFTPAGGTLTVAGDVTLLVVLGPQVRLHGSLTLSATGLVGELSLPADGTGQTVSRPFGVPGLVVEGLSGRLESTFGTGSAPTTHVLTVRGVVRLGRPPAPGTTGDTRPLVATSVVVAQGVPVRMDIVLTEGVSLGGFLAQCLTGNSGAWPAAYGDLVLEAGSRVYYYARSADPAGIWSTRQEPDGTTYSYLDGFNVEANITLHLVTAIPLRFALTVVDDGNGAQHVRGVVQLSSPVDLGYASLAEDMLDGSGTVFVNGPFFTLATGATARLEFEGGVNVLGRAIVGAMATVRRTATSTVVQCVLTSRELPTFGRTSFRVTYTRNADGSDSFRIDNWVPFDWATMLVRFVERIRALVGAATDGCAAVVRRATDSLLRTTYTLSPSAQTTGAGLVFAITGTYAMRIGDDGPVFLTVPLPTITLPPIAPSGPNARTFDQLPEYIGAGITGAADQIVADLRKRPDDIARFLVMAFGPDAAAYAAGLACRGLVDAAVATATEAAATALAAAGVVLGSVLTAAQIQLAVQAISDQLAKVPPQPGPLPGPGGPVGTPALSTLTVTGDRVTGTWTAATGANDYEFRLRSDTGATVATTGPLGALTGGFDVPAATPAGTCRADVVARRGTRSGTSAERPVAKLATPTVTLTFDGTALTATVGGTGDTFAVTFVDGSGRVVGTPATVTPGGPAATLASPAPGTYSVQVRAQRTGSLPSAVAGASAIVLPTPAGLTVVQQDSDVVVTWSAVPEAGRYEMTVQGAGTADRVYGDLTTPQVRFPLPDAVGPGSPVSVRVRSVLGVLPGVSAWSGPVTLTVLPEATNWSVVPGTNPVVLRCDPLPAHGYHVEIRRAAGPLVGRVDSPTNEIALNSVFLFPGQRYDAWVRSTLGASSGRWSTSTDITGPAGGTVLPLALSLQLTGGGDQREPLRGADGTARFGPLLVRVADAATGTPRPWVPVTVAVTASAGMTLTGRSDDGTSVTTTGRVTLDGLTATTDETGTATLPGLVVGGAIGPLTGSATVRGTVPAPAPVAFGATVLPFGRTDYSATSWVDRRDGGTHLCVYRPDPSGAVTEHAYDGGWTAGRIASTKGPVSATVATSWQDPAGVHRRVYCRTPAGVDELCSDAGGAWYSGGFPATGDPLAVTSWVESEEPVHHLRLFCRNEAGRIVEWAWDRPGSGWNRTGFEVDGDAIALTSWFVGGRVHRRAYAVTPGNRIVEYVHDQRGDGGGDWAVGEFSASGSAVAVTSWIDQDGPSPNIVDQRDLHRIRVYCRDDGGAVVEHRWDWDTAGWATGTLSGAGDGIAATAYPSGSGQANVRVYTRTPAGEIVENGSDGGSPTWSSGPLPP